jgi:hypothetical protein
VSKSAVSYDVFSIFMTLSILMFKQFGVGLAAAIVIDATLVRGVLLPATMKLLGERNWYLPAWLEWLPRIEPGGGSGGAGSEAGHRFVVLHRVRPQSTRPGSGARRA